MLLGIVSLGREFGKIWGRFWLVYGFNWFLLVLLVGLLFVVFLLQAFVV